MLSGFEEFGFDFKKGGSLKDQMALNGDLLEIADKKLPLILHIRGNDQDLHSKKAQQICCSFLSERIKDDRCIQLHCFNGDRECVKMWEDKFSNAYFSFSGMVQYFDQGQREALRSIPLKRLLLETDSPYFALQGKCNTPNQLGKVLSVVASIRGITEKELTLTNIYNANKVFKLF